MIKSEEKKVEEKLSFYKGYEMRWLKFDASENHPDKKLVKEYEALYGEIK